MGLVTTVKHRVRSASRYNQILKVLVKYGFEDLVNYLDESNRYVFIQKIIPRASKIKAAQFTKWERMRLVCEELGPTFVKFGQIMSNRPDLIPMNLVLQLEKLQDNVPPVSPEKAREVVETELKGKVDDLFAWFEQEPFASASMAQVHKVTLKSGDRAALKIQRPGIREVIEEDIKVMYRIADLLESRIPSLKSFDPVGLVKNFEEAILKEMDFIHESINAQRFYNNINDDEGHDQYAQAPKVFLDYTTKRVLALEFISGTRLGKFEQLDEAGYDKKVLAKRLSVSYFKQIFEYGFFHADPHPGNLLVVPGTKVCYLDFGMMGSILPRDIEIFGQLFLAITRKDVQRIIKALLRLSNTPVIKNMRALEFDINEFVEKYYVRSIHKNEMSTVLLELKDIIIVHGLKVPSHFFLFARSLVTIEGVIEKLDPELEQFEVVKPYLLKSVSKQYDVFKTGGKVINSLFELGAYMEEFPKDLKNAIHKINMGEIKVDLTHKGIDPMVHILQRVSKQLISAFIIGALIVGAALFFVAEVQPLWRGFSVFGLVSIAIAGLLGIGMIKNISKGDYDI